MGGVGETASQRPVRLRCPGSDRWSERSAGGPRLGVGAHWKAARECLCSTLGMSHASVPRPSERLLQRNTRATVCCLDPRGILENLQALFPGSFSGVRPSERTTGIPGIAEIGIAVALSTEPERNRSYR
jgi:hypothetical protein